MNNLTSKKTTEEWKEFFRSKSVRENIEDMEKLFNEGVSLSRRMWQQAARWEFARIMSVAQMSSIADELEAVGRLPDGTKTEIFKNVERMLRGGSDTNYNPNNYKEREAFQNVDFTAFKLFARGSSEIALKTFLEDGYAADIQDIAAFIVDQGWVTHFGDTGSISKYVVTCWLISDACRNCPRKDLWVYSPEFPKKSFLTLIKDQPERIREFEEMAIFIETPDMYPFRDSSFLDTVYPRHHSGRVVDGSTLPSEADIGTQILSIRTKGHSKSEVIENIKEYLSQLPDEAFGSKEPTPGRQYITELINFKRWANSEVIRESQEDVNGRTTKIAHQLNTTDVGDLWHD